MMLLRVRLPKGKVALGPLLKSDPVSGDTFIIFEVDNDFSWYRPLRVARGQTIPGTGRSEMMDVNLLVEDEDDD